MSTTSWPVFARTLPARIFLVVGLLGTSGISCDSCAGGGGGGGGGSVGGGGGGWLVGQAGLMLNVTMETPPGVNGYQLAARANLRAIACRGDREAWVVGDDGTLLATGDAGVTWRAVDSGVKSALRAVALPARNYVFVAGDQGVLRLSRSGGLDWQTIQAPPVTWTAISARSDGRLALLSTAGGQLYRLDAASGLLSEVATITGALHSAVMARDGSGGVAVGDGGALLVSRDGGNTWRPRASGTTRALRDVWLIHGGQRVMAIGDHGVLIDASLETEDPAVVRTFGDERTMRALHLEEGGHGTAVGDHGTAFVTHDSGATWTEVVTGDPRDILGVDALAGFGHL
jgi:photosystem II stability/assembly factor-like uncharacterized protein